MTWQLASTLIVIAAVAAGFAWYERGRPPSRLVALVAALAALAVAGRVLFAAIPNVQATTDVALLAGYALGPAPGFMVGAIAALASNVFLGQGPWTPWEMLGWGAAGLLGAALARVAGRHLGRVPLALACGLAGMLFGAWMDLFTLLVFAADSTTGGYLAISATSLPFNLAHVIGNILLCLAFGPAMVRMLLRFRRRLVVRWEAPAAANAAALLAAMVVAAALLGTPSPARAGGATAATKQAVRYLDRAQNRDGGFGGAPGQPSNQLITGWTVLGLEAAGRHPQDITRGGRDPVDYIRAGAGSLHDTGELERTILALRGAGLAARRFAGRDLVAELLRRRRGDGSWQRESTLTSFGILALRSAGRGGRSAPVRRAASWLAGQQNDDGGFSFATRGGGSFVDETGAALQALAAAGGKHGRPAAAAVSFLRRAQNQDGGFGQASGQRSNAQSTAWAVQGLAAAGRKPRRFERGGRSPLGFLASLQQTDGSFRYSRTSTQTPVWVTGQAVAALRVEPLPIQHVPTRLPAASRPPAAPAGRSGRPGREPGGERSRPEPTRREDAPGAARTDRTARSVAVRPVARVAGPPAAVKRSSDKGKLPLTLAIPVAVAIAGIWVWAMRSRQRTPPRRGGRRPK